MARMVSVVTFTERWRSSIGDYTLLLDDDFWCAYFKLTGKNTSVKPFQWFFMCSLWLMHLLCAMPASALIKKFTIHTWCYHELCHEQAGLVLLLYSFRRSKSNGPSIHTSACSSVQLVSLRGIGSDIIPVVLMSIDGNATDECCGRPKQHLPFVLWWDDENLIQHLRSNNQGPVTWTSALVSK